MPWIHLLIASVFEVVFALATNATHGFTELGPSLLAAAAASGGIFFLSLALRTLDVGVGYTVWTGIGSVGTVVFGTFVFDEPMTVGKALAFVLIISGVIGLKVADRSGQTTNGATDSAEGPGPTPLTPPASLPAASVPAASIPTASVPTV